MLFYWKLSLLSVPFIASIVLVPLFLAPHQFMHLCPALKQTNNPFYFRLVVYQSYAKMSGMVAVNCSSELMMLFRSSLSCLPHSPGTCKFVKKSCKSLQFSLPFLLDIVLGSTVFITSYMCFFVV